MKNLELAQSSRKVRVTQLGITAGLAMLFLVVLLWGLRGITPAHADPGILYVDGATGQDIVTCGTSSTPCRTISYTLNSRASGDDTIRVAQGVYTENLTIAISVTLEGGYEASGWTRNIAQHETIIDGSGSTISQSVVAFVTGSDGSILDGFTVRNGEAEYGGGIYIDGASPIISGCVIVENRAYTAGGGGFITGDASPLIVASKILSNTAQDGAGLAIYSGATPLVDNNSIISNTADWAGGGVRVIASGGIIQNNLIAFNKAQGWAGGAMEIAVNAWTTVISNSIVGNTADTGGGIAVNWYCTVAIAANEIVSNSTTSWAGGGIYIGDYSAVTIDRNTIAKNRAEGGGGVAINNGSSITATNNVIASNMGLTSTWEGDGILVLASATNSDARIINNTIAFNAAEGVQIHPSTVDLRNNIVVSNTNCGINVLDGAVSTVTLEYNDLWGNTPQDYCNSGPGASDISVNPGFVNIVSDNFHLRSDSPCVDAGTNVGAPSSDFDSDPRPLDGNLDGVAITDIGADEFRPYRIYLPLTLKNVGP